MFTELMTALGLMAWPLLITSCLALAMIIERLWTYILLPSLSRKNLQQVLTQVSECHNSGHHSTAHICQYLSKEKGIHQGISLLLSHHSYKKELREEVAGMWLLNQKRKLNTWLKPLMLIGLLAPMLGLLGTVLGMIDMFSSIAAQSGPITPDLLAAGLQQAMYTTAFGLMIAVPALAASHGFGIWATHYLSRLEFALNHANLLLDGLHLHGENLASNESAFDHHQHKRGAAA